MPEGKVKWFNSKKGYGFIESGSGQDIFVHYKAILGEDYKFLLPGEKVVFEIEDSSQGLKAKNVTKLGL
ncbi:cold shock domain-containing protein [Candidatus Poribacteria bacterium]|nr:cold shock domain-containing protein [Candidatus Poribacteria bacterium]